MINIGKFNSESRYFCENTKVSTISTTNTFPPSKIQTGEYNPGVAFSSELSGGN